MEHDDPIHQPSEVGIAAFQLALGIIHELGWDKDRTRAVIQKALARLDAERPQAAAALRDSLADKWWK